MTEKELIVSLLKADDGCGNETANISLEIRETLAQSQCPAAPWVRSTVSHVYVEIHGVSYSTPLLTTSSKGRICSREMVGFLFPADSK